MSKHNGKQAIEAQALKEALFALTTIELITRRGGVSSAANLILRVRSVTIDALAKIKTEEKT